MDRIEGTTKEGEPYRIVDGQAMEILRDGKWITVVTNSNDEEEKSDGKESSKDD